jgi:4-diphosphocytidyl-2-C-methyl-D-erythritol kinase
MGLPHGAQALAARLADVETALPDLPDELAINDLEPAALALCPAIGTVLDEVRAAGADHVLVSGSGPTVLGLFRDAGAAYLAADELERAGTHAIATVPAGARDARVL